MIDLLKFDSILVSSDPASQGIIFCGEATYIVPDSDVRKMLLTLLRWEKDGLIRHVKSDYFYSVFAVVK